MGSPRTSGPGIPRARKAYLLHSYALRILGVKTNAAIGQGNENADSVAIPLGNKRIILLKINLSTYFKMTKKLWNAIQKGLKITLNKWL